MPENEASQKNADQSQQLVSEAFSDSDWFPWWKKPVLMSDWEQIEYQARISAQSTTETYDRAKATGMPFFFVEMVAKSRYRSVRRYCRIRDRIVNMKTKGMLNLVRAIFGSR